jgi:SpoVK/Ycf46/Vps4 family AAA+-type ATPase
MARLAQDIQAVVDLAKANPAMEGLFHALLVVLENAPDSTIISEALAQVDPTQCRNADYRQRAANLLVKSNRPELARAWLPQEAQVAAPSNVVSLRPAAAEPLKPLVMGEAVSFADIGGLEPVKDQVRRKIIKPFQTPGLFQAFKRKSGGGVLMYGPPGCGKTMLARALAHECHAEFVSVKAAEILDRYVGIAEKRIADLFQRARSRKPTVLFFDEVEALAQRRQFDARDGVNTVVSVLLSEMDGLNGSNEGILFLGATNLPWSLDSAFRRPGRFDRTLFVPPPDRVARAFILKNLLLQRPHDPGLDIEPIVARTPGFSGADLAALVDTATDFAIDDSASANALTPLNAQHFAEAFKECRASTGEWLAQARSYSEYANQDGLYDDLKAFLAQYAR